MQNHNSNMTITTTMSTMSKNTFLLLSKVERFVWCVNISIVFYNGFIALYQLYAYTHVAFMKTINRSKGTKFISSLNWNAFHEFVAFSDSVPALRVVELFRKSFEAKWKQKQQRNGNIHQYLFMFVVCSSKFRRSSAFNIQTEWMEKKGTDDIMPPRYTYTRRTYTEPRHRSWWNV